MGLKNGIYGEILVISQEPSEQELLLLKKAVAREKGQPQDDMGFGLKTFNTIFHQSQTAVYSKRLAEKAFLISSTVVIALPIGGSVKRVMYKTTDLARRYLDLIEQENSTKE